ncbi:MAG: DUF1641 domain-containing protein [Desulfurococcales archaeon]|nr:DUF1641 domain-containing protein [Desulfurococcales archaeon]
MAEEKIRVDETGLEVAALKELMEVAVLLKKSGILGMLKNFLSDSEALMEAFQNDTSMTRLIALLGGVMEATRRVDGAQMASMKENTEETVHCAFQGLATTDPVKANKMGMFGLLGALRDPDVQKGLGFVMMLLKNIGACLNAKEKSKQ